MRSSKTFCLYQFDSVLFYRTFRVLLKVSASGVTDVSMPSNRRLFFGVFSRLVHFVTIACVLCATVSASDSQVLVSEKTNFRVTELASDLEHPWGLAFLPNGTILITERPGRLRYFYKGELSPQFVKGLPRIHSAGQGGLLDIVLDPQFSVNRFIYFSYVRGTSGGMATTVARARLHGMALSELEVIFNAYPMTGKDHHFGSRLLFALDGTLLITLGDRGHRSWAQDRTIHPGSVVRIWPTGAIPNDNPFVGDTQGGDAIFSYGNRNPQGLAMNPSTGEIWMHEHGPRGGDELNRLNAGVNYGWPVISYGREYWSPARVGEGTHKLGLAQPFHYWVPSIAPSGMTFYSGKLFSTWKNNLFIGSLKFKTLVRLELGRDRVLHEERLLPGKYGRIRDVREGPDGAIYLLTDATNGKLLRLDPT